jgi:DHA1 family bicyclomycin/chloramphenicol resistance-like MFS transporter
MTSTAQRPAAAAPPGGSTARLVLVLGTVIALGPFTIDMYLPALPAIATDLRADDAAVKATLTGMLLGLGLGQLLVGPLSDALGRRRPLLAGLVAHGLASLLCALAPDVTVLLAVRVLQGVAGAAVSVVAMATVRDLFTGREAARVLSRMMLLMSTAPLIAPSVGGVVLEVMSWRGIFLVLACAAAALTLVAALGLPETLPVERRRSARPGPTLRTYLSILSDRVFLALALVGAGIFTTLFVYVSGFPFLLQETYGMGARGFALVFALNSLVSVLGTQSTPILLRWFEPRQLLTAAAAGGALAAAVAAVAAATGWGGRTAVLVPVALVIGACGFAMPNTPALALSRHGRAAGTAAAVLGATQFGLGGLVASLAGLLGGRPGVAMAAVMAAALTVALVLLLTVVRQAERTAAS